MKSKILLFVGALTACGWGASFYVSKSGGNTDGTSWAAAWNELNQISWTNVNPGDTVRIAGGTYTTALTLSKAGTRHNRIMVMRATDAGHNGKVTMAGSTTISQPQSDAVGILVTQPYVTVDGVDKTLFEFNKPGISHIFVNVANTGDCFEIKNALFRNTPNSACWSRCIHVASGGLSVDHCEFSRSQCQEDIISYKSTNAKLKIRYSVVRGWVAIDGSHSDLVEGGTGGNPQSDSLIFTNNLVDDGVPGGVNICFMMYNTWNYADVSYNVFKDVAAILQGEYLAGRMVNNTYFRTAGQEAGDLFANNIYADDTALTNTDRFNWATYSLFNNTRYDSYFSSTPDASGNLRGDPRFLNPESILGADSLPFTADDGFNLQSNSPAINRGTAVGFSADIRNTPVSGRPDIGAYEYAIGTAVTPGFAGEGCRYIGDLMRRVRHRRQEDGHDEGPGDPQRTSCRTARVGRVCSPSREGSGADCDTRICRAAHGSSPVEMRKSDGLYADPPFCTTLN